MNSLKKIQGSLLVTITELISEWRTILIIVTPIFFILLYWAFQNTNIGFLQLHSIDEYVFHGSLRHMYEGLIDGSIKALFGYGFYQYGFIYFFINLMAVIPAFIFDNSALAVAIPRVITSLFAIGSLVFIFKFTRLYINKVPAILFTLFFITMPAFWYNATWFHPDWAMTFWLLGFVYFLAKDKFTYSNNFWIGVIFYSLAVAFKYQAITAIPILGLYIFYNQLRGLNLSEIFNKIEYFIKTLLIIFTVFILTNPFILHPIGWHAFTNSFVSNMESNSTNHGNAHEVSFVEKVNLAVGDYYLNIIFLFILLVSAFWLIWKFFRSEERNLFFIIAFNFIINLSYLFIFVNKAWQTYYLPVIFIGALCLIYYLKSLSIKQINIAIILAMLIQIIIFSSFYTSILNTSRDNKASDFNTYSLAENEAMNEFIVGALSGENLIEKNVLITPYTPFDYEKTDLKYENVRFIFGPLVDSYIDSQSYLKSQKEFWKEAKTNEQILSTFKPIDYIILRKDIPFIDTKKIELIIDKEPYLQSVSIVSKLYDGSLNYRILAESDTVVIFVLNKK